MDEETFDKTMKSSLDDPMPGGFELPEDTTGTGVGLYHRSDHVDTW